jgi:PBP1b-binding outer membrane lipoprotein LpoB
MLRQFFVIFLILSVVIISGCVQQAPSGGQAVASGAEDQAVDKIEQEMESAIENMTMEDIERALTE